MKQVTLITSIANGTLFGKENAQKIIVVDTPGHSSSLNNDYETCIQMN